MTLLLKTKTQILLAVIILEITLGISFAIHPGISPEDLAAYLTGMQFVIFAMLFMPDTRHGIGERKLPNFREVQERWKRMSKEEQRKIVQESRHDSWRYILYMVGVFVSVAFMLFIWIPIVFPELSKLIS